MSKSAYKEVSQTLPGMLAVAGSVFSVVMSALLISESKICQAMILPRLMSDQGAEKLSVLEFTRPTRDAVHDKPGQRANFQKRQAPGGGTPGA